MTESRRVRTSNSSKMIGNNKNQAILLLMSFSISSFNSLRLYCQLNSLKWLTTKFTSVSVCLHSSSIEGITQITRNLQRPTWLISRIRGRRPWEIRLSLSFFSSTKEIIRPRQKPSSNLWCWTIVCLSTKSHLALRISLLKYRNSFLLCLYLWQSLNNILALLRNQWLFCFTTWLSRFWHSTPKISNRISRILWWVLEKMLN